MQYNEESDKEEYIALSHIGNIYLVERKQSEDGTAIDRHGNSENILFDLRMQKNGLSLMRDYLSALSPPTASEVTARIAVVVPDDLVPRKEALKNTVRTHGIGLEIFDNLEVATKWLLFGEETTPESSDKKPHSELN
jgi:hypothetical protein